MRKILVGLLVAGLILAGSMGFAQDKEAKPSLQVASLNVREAIRENPISVVDYFDMSIDFVTELMNRLLKTGKPVFLLRGQAGLEITLYEQDNYNIIAGLTPNEKFVGVEVTSLPLSGDVERIFSKLHPIVVYEFDDYNGLGLGLAYEFREEK